MSARVCVEFMTYTIRPSIKWWNEWTNRRSVTNYHIFILNIKRMCVDLGIKAGVLHCRECRKYFLIRHLSGSGGGFFFLFKPAQNIWFNQCEFGTPHVPSHNKWKWYAATVKTTNITSLFCACIIYICIQHTTNSYMRIPSTKKWLYFVLQNNSIGIEIFNSLVSQYSSKKYNKKIWHASNFSSTICAPILIYNNSITTNRYNRYALWNVHDWCDKIDIWICLEQNQFHFFFRPPPPLLMRVYDDKSW